MSFHTLLVANRGEIARRVMRSARDMGLRCAAVFVDADANAPHLRDADLALRLPGSYLDGAAIIAAARRAGAGAIHPGYGFLSENAAFASAVQETGITWVGPAPDAIARMGDKLQAKALAQQADVPILPGANDAADAASVGFPLLVKAAAGGGGKGMRIVEAPGDLAEAVAAAEREAQSGFGDSRVFLERYLPRARHIEIQILGDAHGGLVHLGERECSVQRRHQKIIEESPSPRVSAELRERMGAAALRLARALNYRSAGTVEFLLDDESGEFFFLEVNTRLQVEHPVTEAITGIDLVREQLRIAQGEPLDFAQSDIRARGAAIEARLYAEDPANDFLPVTGTLAAFEPAAAPAVRWDSGVVTGSVVGADFDPMLAKVTAHAPTRAEAAGRLALALERLHIAGLTTNRDFLAAVLRHPAFLAGDTTTDFIQRVAPPRRRNATAAECEFAARFAALWLQGENRAAAATLGRAPSGWRNSRMPEQRHTFAAPQGEISVGYRALRGGRFRFAGPAMDVEQAAEAGLPLGAGAADGADEAQVHAWTPDSLDAEIAGRRCHARISRAGGDLVVHLPQGDLALTLKPRFELPGAEESGGGLSAPMPGKVIELRVKQGDRVRAGQTLVVLEAMKMEHPIAAAEDGVVSEVRVALGDQVENGALLLTVESAAEDGGAD